METVGNATLNGVTLNGNYLGDVGTNTFVSGTITQTGNLQLNAGNGNNTEPTSPARRRSPAAPSRWPTTGRAAAPSISSSRAATRRYERRDDPWHRHHRQWRLTLVNTATGIINADVSGDADDQPRQRPRRAWPACRTRACLRRRTAAPAVLSQNVVNTGNTITATARAASCCFRPRPSTAARSRLRAAVRCNRRRRDPERRHAERQLPR